MKTNLAPQYSYKLALASLSSIFALRMLGIFMILPVFSVYAQQLEGATPKLIGLALGIYGLTQASLQIPFATLSDYIGRKKVITIGLLIFALGSLIAATAHTLLWMIFGRALQGAGAIGSTLIAYVADLTPEAQRTKAMAILGITIGSSFALSLVFSPLFTSWFNVSGIFWLTTLLALMAIIVTHTLIPTIRKSTPSNKTQPLPQLFKTLLKNKELSRLNIGIFTQHTILTATFFVIPLVFHSTLAIPLRQQWPIYFAILLASFMTMFPLISVAEKFRQTKLIFLIAIGIIGLAQLGLWQWHTQLWSIMICLFIFFTGFNLLEALLPSLISKFAPAHGKGTALGIYSTSQFLGIFLGGSLGGWLYSHHQMASVFYVNAVLALFWLTIALGMKKHIL